MDGHHRAVRTMLGGHTVARFTSLEFEQRRAIFRKHLVQRKPVIIGEGDGDDSLNPDTATGVLLRQQHFMVNDDTGKKLVQDACEVYYGENDFNFRLHWLCEFKTDLLGGYIIAVAIAPLMKKEITVVADLHDEYSGHHLYEPNADAASADQGVDDEKSVHYRHGATKMARWTQKYLQDLFLFTNATKVTLVLFGRGLLDGSDLATH